MSVEVLRYKKLKPEAFEPTRNTPGSAGLDLTSPITCVVPPQNWVTVPLDLAIELPPGCYGRIAPRSGLVATQGVTVDAGVIDADFTGNIAVVLVNRSNRQYVVHRGERIAQLICERCIYPEIKEVVEIKETSRGEKGFGSSLKFFTSRRSYE